MTTLLSQLQVMLATWDAAEYSSDPDDEDEGDADWGSAGDVAGAPTATATPLSNSPPTCKDRPTPVKPTSSANASVHSPPASAVYALDRATTGAALPIVLSRTDGGKASTSPQVPPPSQLATGEFAYVTRASSRQHGHGPDSGGGARADGPEEGASLQRIHRRFSRHTRAALSRVELARAALALYTSNAGPYRPILRKLLAFVFAYMDYLVEEQARARHAQAVGGYGARPRPHPGQGDVGGGDSLDGDGGGLDGSTSADGNDAVANAFQRVRIVEARMAALVEEASAQRDRYKAQIAAQQVQQEKLEGLLRHQVELNHVLANRPIGTPDGAEDGQGLEWDVAPGGGAMTGAELERLVERRRQHDARYVQRLIARAEKEKVLEELETQVGELAAERARLSGQVLSLQKLNSRYARQAVELAARMSIVHEHNIGLAADAQLFQRDAIKDRQLAEKMERDLAVSRNMLLTFLEMRRREVALGVGVLDGGHAGEALALAAAPGGVAVPAGRQPPPSSASLSTTLVSATASPRGARVERLEGGPLDSTAAAPAPPQLAGAAAGPSSTPAAQEQERLELVVSRVRDEGLREKLQSILTLNDAALGGATKSALLSVLSVGQRDRRQAGGRGFGGAAGGVDGPFAGGGGGLRGAGAAEAVAALAEEIREHLWATPYGHCGHTPRHLRSVACVRLLPMHPLVAESLIHELLSQRQDLIDYLGQEAEARALLSLVPAAAPEGKEGRSRARNKDGSTSGVSAPAAARRSRAESVLAVLSSSPPPIVRMTPLDAFVELFVNIVWLNRSERFLSLLPSSVQGPLRSEAGAARTGGRADPASPMRGVWQQQLQSLVQSARRLPEALLQLPVEGLRLTYSLDAASRRCDAGFLSYAFGLASRQQLSEVVFDVLLRERAVFLTLCEHVDAARAEAKAAEAAALRARTLAAVAAAAAAPASHPAQEAQKKSEASRGERSDSSGTTAPPPPPPKPAPPPPVELLGCIPTVQLARILATMFPGYPVEKLEEMVLAAVADGTDGTQSPVMVYYTVLLPERLLPGSAAAAATDGTDRVAASLGTAQVPPRRSTRPPPPRGASATALAASIWDQGRFAQLFFKSICDDAMEALQAVEDSLSAFAEARLAAQAAKRGPLAGPGGPSSPPRLAEAMGEDGGAARTLGGGGDPTRATVKQILTVGLQGVPPAEERRWGGAIKAVLQRWPVLSRTAMGGGEPQGGGGGQRMSGVSGATPGAGTQTGASDPDDGLLSALYANPAAVTIPIAGVAPLLRRHLFLRRGPFPTAHTRDSIAAMISTPAPPEGEAGCSDGASTNSSRPGASGWWSLAQLTYMDSLQERWAQYVMDGEPPLPTEVTFFYNALWRVDPSRSLPWSTDAAGSGHVRLMRCPTSEQGAAAAAAAAAAAEKVATEAVQGPDSTVAVSVDVAEGVLHPAAPPVTKSGDGDEGCG